MNHLKELLLYIFYILSHFEINSYKLDWLKWLQFQGHLRRALKSSYDSLVVYRLWEDCVLIDPEVSVPDIHSIGLWALSPISGNNCLI